MHENKNKTRRMLTISVSVLFLIMIIIFMPSVLGADGDVGIWYDDTGGQDMTGTRDTWYKFPFDTADGSVPSIYTMNGTNDGVQVGETGMYLVMYHIVYDSAYSSRIGHESRVTINDAPIYGSYGSSYTRTTAEDVGFLYGYALANCTANQYISVEYNYRTDNGDQTVIAVADESSLQILKLDDDWKYFQAHKDTADTYSENSWLDIEWDVADREDNIYTHPYSADDGQIQVSEDGHYLFLIGMGFKEQTQRKSLSLRLLQNGNPVEQSYTYKFVRDYDDHRDVNPTVAVIVNASANDYFEVETYYEANTVGDADIPAVITHCGIDIIQLPDGGDYYSGHGDDTIDPHGRSTTFVVVDMIDTEDEEYGGSFDGNPSTSVVNIDQDGWYLMFANMQGTRTDTANDRANVWVKFFKSGVETTYGASGWYSRGNQGNDDTYKMGGSLGMMMNLTSSDYLDVRAKCEGTGTTSANERFDANQYGISMVRLDDLFPDDAEPTWQTQDDLNGSYYNQTSWISQNDLNGSYYNVTNWINIDDFNGSYHNQTSWNTENDLNGSYYNTTSGVELNTTIDTIVPYEITTSPWQINATNHGTTPDQIGLYYRHNASGGWHEDWGYSKMCDIGEPVDDYQMFINVSKNSGGDVDCEGHCNDNFSDIRFLDVDNTTQLDYWMEHKVDGQYAWFWVKTPSDASSDGGIVLYYNNSVATTTSDGNATFPIYFENWKANASTDFNHTISINYYRWHMRLIYDPTNCSEDTRLRWRMNYSDGHLVDGFSPNTYIGYFNENCSADENPDDMIAFRINIDSDPSEGCDADTTGGGTFVRSNDSTTKNNYLLDFQVDEWFIYENRYLSNKLNSSVYDDFNNIINGTEIASSDPDFPAYSELDYFGFAQWDANEKDNPTFGWYHDDYLRINSSRNDGGRLENYIDWMFISNYTSAEPSWSSFSAEGSSGWSDWLWWDNSNNPDTGSPWEWDFDFPNGTAGYQFYSEGNLSGYANESAPETNDTGCYYNPPPLPWNEQDDINGSYYSTSWHTVSGSNGTTGFIGYPSGTGSADIYDGEGTEIMRGAWDEMGEDMGTADNITVKFGNLGSDQTYECALYEYVDIDVDYAGGLVAVTESKNISTDGQNSEHTFDFSDPKPTLNASSRYYIIVRMIDNGTGSQNNIYKATESGYAILKMGISGVPPEFESPLTDEAYTTNRPYIFCNFSANPLNGSYFNVSYSTWQTQDDLNGSYFNSTSWNSENDINGSYHNSTGWNTENDLNGSYYNQSSWITENDINGSYYNTSSFQTIDDLNGTYYNITGWTNIDDLNGSYYNITDWSNIDDINGSYYSSTSWRFLGGGDAGFFGSANQTHSDYYNEYDDDESFYAGRWNLPVDAVITNMWMTIKVTNNPRPIRGALYDNSYNFIAWTEEYNITHTDYQWVNLSFTEPVSLTAGNYHLASFQDADATNKIRIGRMDDTGFGSSHRQVFNHGYHYPAYPDPFDANSSNDDFQIFRCNYTEAHINGSYYNSSSWNTENDINGSYYNQSSFQTVDDLNGSYYNSTDWSEIDDLNGSYYNSTIWESQNDLNGSYYNSTSWDTVDTLNGSYYNSTSWDSIDDLNGTYYNITGWINIDDLNGSYYNITGWESQNDINGSYYNSTDWSNIDDINGTYYNSTGWNNIDDINGSYFNQSSWNSENDINGSYYNTSSFQTIDDLNGSYWNQTGWEEIDDLNGTYYNVTGWNNIDDINGSYYNSTSWDSIDDLNGTYYNITGWINIDDLNGSYYNITGWESQNDINGSYYNSTDWSNIDDINGTYYNSTGWNNIDDINGSYYNSTSWDTVDTLNGSYYNSTIFSIIDNLNGSYYNSTGWENQNDINGSYWNGTDWSNIDDINGSYYNSTDWSNIDDLNGSYYNQSSWNSENDLNGSYYNITGWDTIDNLNGSYWNGTDFQTIDDLNGTYYNSTDWTTIDDLNGTYYNITGWENQNDLNGSYWNGTDYNSVDDLNGSYYNTTSWNTVDTLNGSYYNITPYYEIDDLNGSYYNQTPFYAIDDLNGSYYNVTPYHTEDEINGDYYNSTDWNDIDDLNGSYWNSTDYIDIDELNGSYYNASSWNTENDLNGTYYNSTDWTEENDHNGSYYNITGWETIDTLNGSYWNGTDYNNIDDINGSYFNQSSWNSENDLNGSYYNSTDWSNIDDLNGSYWNTSDYQNIDDLNGSYFNLSIWYNQNNLNGSYWNVTGWSSENDLNGSYFNLTLWINIDDLNGSYYNSTPYSTEDELNGTYFNITIWENIDDLNGSYFNLSTYFIHGDLNGSYYNGTTHQTIQNINGTYYNITTLFYIIDEFPINNSLNKKPQPTVYFTIVSMVGRDMNYTIYIGDTINTTTTQIDNASNISNGTYHYNNYYQAYNYSKYWWRVEANDGHEIINESYCFTNIRGIGRTQEGGRNSAGLAIAGGGLILGFIFFIFIIGRRPKKPKKNPYRKRGLY